MTNPLEPKLRTVKMGCQGTLCVRGNWAPLSPRELPEHLCVHLKGPNSLQLQVHGFNFSPGSLRPPPKNNKGKPRKKSSRSRKISTSAQVAFDPKKDETTRSPGPKWNIIFSGEVCCRCACPRAVRPRPPAWSSDISMSRSGLFFRSRRCRRGVFCNFSGL